MVLFLKNDRVLLCLARLGWLDVVGLLEFGVAWKWRSSKKHIVGRYVRRSLSRKVFDIEHKIKPLFLYIEPFLLNGKEAFKLMMFSSQCWEGNRSIHTLLNLNLRPSNRLSSRRLDRHPAFDELRLSFAGK